MDEESVPGVEDVRGREIVDVDVPVVIERGRNQQTRPVVEQNVPGLMEEPTSWIAFSIAAPCSGI
jgi:hypothetical protein